MLLTGATLTAEIVNTIKNVLQNDGEGAGHFIRIARFIGEIDATRQDVVDAMISLEVTGEIVMAPESNTKMLQVADKRHAVRVGSEYMHLVALQS